MAYGTLLGAVREQRFLGHDSDADLAYVSESGNPCDVVRESFRLQRAVHERGFRTYRYSGAAFRDRRRRGRRRRCAGSTCSRASSTSRRRGSRLYLMGEIGADFRREWVYPLGTCTLEGHTFPAPAVAGALLEATYGPSWAVPDPAFKFTTPRPHGPPADRLVPRYVGQPGRLGAQLQRQPRQAADQQAVRRGAQGRPSASPTVAR